MPTLRCHTCGRTFTNRQARRTTRAVARQLVALFNAHHCSPAAVRFHHPGRLGRVPVSGAGALAVTYPDQASSHYWASPANLEETHRAALKALDSSGKPQAVHLHPAGQPCRRGECYVLRKGQ